MIKEIKYNGYSANPSDYECADGDLSVAMNLIPRCCVCISLFSLVGE